MTSLQFIESSAHGRKFYLKPALIFWSLFWADVKKKFEKENKEKIDKKKGRFFFDKSWSKLEYLKK